MNQGVLLNAEDRGALIKFVKANKKSFSWFFDFTYWLIKLPYRLITIGGSILLSIQT